MSADVDRIKNLEGPERSAAIIRACLTPEQQPHAEAIIEAFEDALHQLSLAFDERAGTALLDAHRRGDDPAEVARQWL
jgi:hypothetical protein